MITGVSLEVKLLGWPREIDAKKAHLARCLDALDLKIRLQFASILGTVRWEFTSQDYFALSSALLNDS